MREKLRSLADDLSILRGNFLVLLVTWVIFRFAFRLVMPYEPLYIRALGATPTVLGLMSAAYTAVFCLSLIPGSYVADRWGRKRIIVTMTYVLGFSYVFYILAPDWPFSPGWQLVLAGMLFAALARIYMPALQAMTADSLPPERRGLGYALTAVVPDAFATASPLVAAILVGRYGLVEGMRLAYTAVFGSFMVAATVRLLFLRETVRPAGPRGRMGIARFYAESAREMLGALKEAPRPLKALVFIPLLVVPLSQALWSTFAPLFIVDFTGISEAEWGTISSIRLAFGLAAGLLAGKLADKLSRKKLLVVRYIASAPVVVGLAFAEGFVEVLAILLLLDLTAFIGMSASQALLADLTPREMRGRVLGARTLLMSLSSIPASPLVGFIYESVDPRLPFLALGVLSLVAALAMACLVEEPAEREI